MSKKQKGIYIQIAGVVLWIALVGPLGGLAPVIGIITILVGGYIYRTGKKEEKDKE